jgi:hypothetical protein|tara:strand:- start:2546 stop:3412 length:867 start_codon:yes stop_codon:yes gene_type:complete
MTDLVSLSELRQLTRQRADNENSQFVTDTELTRYLNNSWGELYNLIIENFNEDYFTTSHSFSLTSGTDSYSLPSDFYKSRGVDLVVTNTESVPLRRYNWAERTRNSVTVRARDYRYRIQKGSIIFTPLPSTNDSIKIFYIPDPRKLESVTPSGVTRGTTTTYTVSSHSFVADDVVNVSGFLADDYNSQQTVQSVTNTTIVTDLNSSALSDPTLIGTVESVFDFYSGWDEYVIIDSAIKILIKEEADVTALLLQKNQMRERIITESQNRDAGEPQTVTDVVSYHKFYYA